MHQPASRANTEKLEGRDGSPVWIQQVWYEEFPSSAVQHRNSSLEHVDYFHGAFSLCFYSGLKCSRSPCTFSKCLSCRVCNSLYHHIHIWSTMSVSGEMQKSLLPLSDKHQHRWSRTTATNLGCMKVAFGLICLSFLWNSLYLDTAFEFISLFPGTWKKHSLFSPLWESSQSKIKTQLRRLQSAFVEYQGCLQTSLPTKQWQVVCHSQEGMASVRPSSHTGSVLLHLLTSQLPAHSDLGMCS